MVDAWAWIEYLEGSPRGESARNYIENVENDLFCTAVSVAEVVSKFLRRGRDPAVAFKAIARFSRIVEIDGGLASDAGEVHAKFRQKIGDFGLADAFAIVVAEKLEAKILTGDPHFRGLKNALMI